MKKSLLICLLQVNFLCSVPIGNVSILVSPEVTTQQFETISNYLLSKIQFSKLNYTGGEIVRLDGPISSYSGESLKSILANRIDLVGVFLSKNIFHFDNQQNVLVFYWFKKRTPQEFALSGLGSFDLVNKTTLDDNFEKFERLMMKSPALSGSRFFRIIKQDPKDGSFVSDYGRRNGALVGLKIQTLLQEGNEAGPEFEVISLQSDSSSHLKLNEFSKKVSVAPGFLFCIK